MAMTPCLEWTGSKYSNGYGRIWNTELKRMVLVHRQVMADALGWEAIRGQIVLHKCDNPICHRLDHLQIGTLSDNTQDMVTKGRACPGFTVGNTYGAKIDREMANAIRVEYLPSVRQIDLAERYGISQRMVSKIVRDESWRT